MKLGILQQYSRIRCLPESSIGDVIDEHLHGDDQNRP